MDTAKQRFFVQTHSTLSASLWIFALRHAKRWVEEDCGRYTCPCWEFSRDSKCLLCRKEWLNKKKTSRCIVAPPSCGLGYLVESVLVIPLWNRVNRLQSQTRLRRPCSGKTNFGEFVGLVPERPSQICAKTICKGKVTYRPECHRESCFEPLRSGAL